MHAHMDRLSGVISVQNTQMGRIWVPYRKKHTWGPDGGEREKSINVAIL